MVSESRPNELIEAMRALVGEVLGLDTRGYEQADVARIIAELVPEVERLMEGTDAALKRVFEYYEPQTSSTTASPLRRPDSESFGRSVDHLMRTRAAEKRIADISFIARMELTQKRKEIRRSGHGVSRWEIIAVCASVRRRVLKLASAIEQAICLHEQVDFEDHWYATELQRSLEVRRAYARFRKSLSLRERPHVRELRPRIRLAGTSIAILIGRSGYEDFRISDRSLLRDLQARIIAWVSTRSKSRFPVREGLRLWQDISGSADMLMQINGRTELRENDAALISELRGSWLPRRSATAALDDELRRVLDEQLYGSDWELDALMERDEPVTVAELEDHLARLDRQISPTLETVPTEDDEDDED